MDNVIFNVNGHCKQLLVDTIALLFQQRRWTEERPLTVEAWSVDTNKGLILYWHYDGKAGSSPFPVKLGAKAAAELVWEWLQSEQAEKIELTGWDIDADIDGSTTKGWRVYTEDWGNIGNNSYALAAITPAYMWHGK